MIIKRLKKLWTRWWAQLIVIFIGLGILLLFKDQAIIAGGDSSHFLDFGNLLGKFASTWYSKENLGAPNISLSQLSPTMLLWAGLKFIGLPIWLIQRFWAGLLSIGAGLSMFYLICYLFRQQTTAVKIGAILGSTLYLYNMFIVIDPLQVNYRPIHAVLPLLLLLWMKGLNKPSFDYRIAIIFGMASLLAAASYINLAAASIIPLILGLYFIYHLLTKPRTWKRSLWFMLAAVGNFLLFNLWWIITSLVFMFKVSGQVGETASNVSFVGSAQISDTFRFLGSWAFETTYNGLPLFSYSQLYTTGFLVLTTFLVTVVVVAAILKRQLLRSTLFFLILGLLGIFLAKGTNPPWGEFFSWLEQLPNFWIFREPFSKFTPVVVLSFSVLLGLAVTKILAHLRAWPRCRQWAIGVPIILGLLSLVLVNAFPLLTGRAIWDTENMSMKSMHAKVPAYWHDLSAWLNRHDHDARIFLLPRASYGHAYRWDSGVSASGYVAVPLLPNPVSGYPAANVYPKDKVLAGLYDLLESEQPEQFARALSVAGFKYVLQQNDLEWQQGLLFKSPAPYVMKQKLAQVQGLDLVQSFGKLDLYRVGGEYLSEQVNVTDRVAYSQVGTDQVFAEAEFDDGALLSSFFLESQLSEMERSTVADRATDFIVPVKTDENSGEIYLDAPRTNRYQIAWRHDRDTGLKIDGRQIDFRRGSSQGGEVGNYRLANFSLIDPRNCTGNDGRARLRYFVPRNLSLASDKLPDVLVDGRPVTPVDINPKERTIDLCLDINIDSAGLVKTWAPLAEASASTDLYESELEAKFDDGLTTSREDRKNLAAYLGGHSLSAMFEAPLAEPYSVDIGHIKPNRVVVMVPAGEVPGANFQLYFLKQQGEPGLPEVSLQTEKISAYLQTSSAVDLTAGKHFIQIVGDTFKSSDSLILTRADDIHQPVQFSSKPRGLTKWDVTVPANDRAAVLILKDSFHHDWQATLNGQPLADHLPVEGYANAWILPPGENQQITISFTPQRNLWIGVIILAGYGGWSIIYLWRRRGLLGLATISLEIDETARRTVSAGFLTVTTALVDFGYLLFAGLILFAVFTRWGQNLAQSNQLAVAAFVLLVILVAIKLLAFGKKAPVYRSLFLRFFALIFSWSGHKIKWLCANHWPALVIGGLGLVSQIWLRDNLILAGGDNFLYLDPGAVFNDYLNTAMLKFNGGLPNSVVNLLFPFLAFWKGLGSLGLSNLVAQRIWLYLLFTLPGLTMYALIINLSRRPLKIAAFAGGLLYMANIFIALDVLQITIKPIHAFLPLLFLLWMKGLRAKTGGLYYALAFGLISVFFASSSANIAVMGAPALILLAYTAYFFLTHRRRILSGIKFIGQTFVTLILANLWWLIVSIPAMLALNEQLPSEIRRLGFEERTHLVEAFRLMGFWAFNTELAPSVPLVPYADNYYHLPIVMLATFAIPVIALAVFLLKKRISRLVIFFGLLALGGLFIIKGVNEPLGSVYQFLRNNVAAFWIFREPFTKFMLIYLFALAVLFGISIQLFASVIKESTSRLKSWWGRRLYWLIPIVAAFLVIAAAYPLFTGQNIQDHTWYNNPRLSLRVKIPDYWNELDAWLTTNDPTSRIALFPKAGYGHSYYWNSGMSTGNYVADVLLPNPLMRQPNIQSITPTDKLAAQLYEKVNQKDVNEFNQLLGILQIKYILQQDDLAWDHAMADTPNPEVMRAFLESDEKLRRTQTFGKLSLYEYKDFRSDAMVEAKSALQLVDAAGGELGVQEQVIANYTPEKAVLVRNIYEPGQLKALEDLIAEASDSNGSTIRAEQVSATRWQVEVTGTDDFLLTLKTTFLKGWRATVLPSGKSFNPWNRAGLISDSRHVMTDGYANGWIISPPACVQSQECGSSYQVVIDYYPQDVLYLGALISGVALALFVVLLIIIRCRRARALPNLDYNHEDITG